MPGVTPLASASRVKSCSPAQEARRKRLAIQLAAQLPEDEDEALAVLNATETLVKTFLGRPRPV